MASTDAKSGFRLPWSTDRTESDEQADASQAEQPAVDQSQPQSESETPTMIETAPTPSNEAVQEESAVPNQATGATPAAAPTRKANKFMADLTKAMQVAAEAARADTLERFSAEAKAHIESIHASTSDESTELRKKADDDIAAIREWSKAEIARIREETDERVTHRKEKLEREIEAHAAEIEGRIERVQARVASFEAEMAMFFERLLAEDDPTRFAAMAETLPEPPPFDADEAWAGSSAIQETTAAVEPPLFEIPVAEAPADTTEIVEAPADAPAEAPDAEVVAESTPVEAMPEAAVDANTDWGQPDSGDLFGISPEEQAPVAEGDPRLTALGVEQNFAAAEAEAAAFPAETANPDDEIPTIAEDALAARLAGLVAEDHSTPADVATTRVVVTGLVSVASIAGFKRNLARVSGVRSVGVSSGPDGEFVFAVTHEPDLGLADGIATLPGFSARVTNEAPGELTVAARDPESEG
ncbi:MAG TPA: hypothetical protein VFP66_07120 [Candidatus Limnocylindrales bacterium]|nr:hypothetical protein [Candidatus Limnocylindrales bacterium]